MNSTRVSASLFFSLVLTACGGGGNSSPAPNPVAPSVASSKLVLGYFTGSSDSMISATATATPVNAVSMDQIGASSDGSLSGMLSASLLSGGKAAGKTFYACISNVGAADFDPAIAHGAMVTNRAVFIQNIVALAKTSGLTGINIDFEGIYPADRDAYSSFVSDLAAQLHAIHSTLMLSVPAKTADDANDDWSWPYDYAALGQNVDYLQVMTYDQHVPGSAPGPVAGSDWMQASLQYAAAQIPSSKILLGLPAYGYDWNVTTNAGNQVAWKDMPALLASTGAAPKWDAATNSAFIDYKAADGSPHEVWYETPQSIQVKARYAATFKLAGVSVWALGLEDANFWSAMSAVGN